MAVKLYHFHTHILLIIKYLFLMSIPAELLLEGVLRRLLLSSVTSTWEVLMILFFLELSLKWVLRRFLLTSVTSTWEFLMILLFLEFWHMKFHLCINLIAVVFGLNN